MKLLKEQLERMKQIDLERERLSRELEEIKESYKKKDEYLYSKRASVYDVNSYNLDEAIKVICYLVSIVEEKEYTYHEIELPLKESVSGSNGDFGWAYVDLDLYNHPAFRNKIKLQYICCDEEAAAKEIQAVIHEAHAMGVRSYNSKPLPLFYELLTTPAKNYVQINLNNGHKDHYQKDGCIKFICNDEFGQNYPITLININSKICDPNFMYIVDFMYYLTMMKLEKEYCTLTLEEMMEYARDFAEEVKRQKSGQPNKLLKKVIVEV